jgi:hypothetical protein
MGRKQTPYSTLRRSRASRARRNVSWDLQHQLSSSEEDDQVQRRTSPPPPPDVPQTVSQSTNASTRNPPHVPSFLNSAARSIPPLNLSRISLRRVHPACRDKSSVNTQGEPGLGAVPSADVSPSYSPTPEDVATTQPDSPSGCPPGGIPEDPGPDFPEPAPPGPPDVPVPVAADQPIPDASVMRKFLALTYCRGVSLANGNAMWEFFRENVTALHECKLEAAFTGKDLPCFKTIRRRTGFDLPPILLSCSHRDLTTGDIVRVDDVATFPKKKFQDRQRYKLLSEVTSVSLKDLVKFHTRIHPDMNPSQHPITISIDGVPESKSGGLTFDVFSVRFSGCRNIYPVRIVKTQKGAKVGFANFVNPVIAEIIECGLSVDYIVADAPMRAKILGMKQHGSYQGCGKCAAAANCIKVSDESNATVRVWPASTFGHRPRTRASIEASAVLRAQAGVPDVAGIVTRSPFLDLPDFDLPRKVGTDYMHNIAKGNTLRFLELVTDAGSTRSSACKEETVRATAISASLRKVRLPREFQRRTRDINLHTAKASELRNMAMILFPCIGKLMRIDSHLRCLWYLYAFICRALILPDDEFANVDKPALRASMRTFYAGYEKEFGLHHCTFNLHEFTHMVDSREDGELTAFSAFPFESSYAPFVNSYHAGTMSTAKSAINNTYGRLVTDVTHRCKKRMYIAPKVTAASDDTIVYTSGYQFHRVLRVQGRSLICSPITVRDFEPAADVDFGSVGVFVYGDTSDDECVLLRSDVKGKGCIVLNVLVAIAANLLLE